jgi:sec-independent protein translocase protein TatB
VIPNISWGEMLILLVAALVILGPERLPGAIKWTFDALRKVREYAGGATAQLREELGPEFDDLRQPLAQLQQMRGMTPRAVIAKHLLDGDDSLLRDFEEAFPGGKLDLGTSGSANDLFSDGASSPMAKPTQQQPLRAGERPPIDTDAT